MKTALVLAAVLFVWAGIVVVLMGVTSRRNLDDQSVLEIFFPGVEAKDVAELQYWADARRTGYRICARVVLRQMEGSSVAQGEEAVWVPAPDSADLRERWVFEVGGRRAENLADKMEDVIARAPWFGAVDPSAATVFVDGGANSLTTDYVHWWVLPKSEPRTVFLVGAGT